MLTVPLHQSKPLEESFEFKLSAPQSTVLCKSIFTALQIFILMIADWMDDNRIVSVLGMLCQSYCLISAAWHYECCWKD